VRRETITESVRPKRLSTKPEMRYETTSEKAIVKEFWKMSPGKYFK
jgi:hypothetical protein